MKEIRKELKRGHKEQGFILIVGMIVMAFLLLLALPFLFQLSLETKLTNKSYKSSAALSLAEAGVERAIWELNYGDISSWSGDTHVRTMTIASFQTLEGNVIGDIEIRVEEPDTENPVVESLGIVDYVESHVVSRMARVVLEEDKFKPWTHGIFGDEELDFSSNAYVDSYDSTEGPYGGSNVGSEGDVGTNGFHYGCIDLDSNARIYGSAFSGPGSDPDVDIITRSNSYIDGVKDSFSERQEMLPVEPPEALLSSGDFIRGEYFLGSNSSDIISESGVYDSFRLESNSTVTITADVTLYISGEFSMLSNTRLEILDGVKVMIYLGGSFEQSSNSQINNLSENPTQLLILGTDSFNGTMEWRSNTQFWGAVYVPKAHVNFRSNTDFYGSISSKSFEFNSNAGIHYDVALNNLEIDGAEGNPYTVRSWQEVISP